MTSLAMALAFAGVAQFQTIPPFPPLDPSSLNEFMSNTMTGLLFPGGLFDDQGNVLMDDTARLVGRNTGKTSLRRDGTLAGFDSIVDPTGAYKALDDALCSASPHPMIVGVDANASGVPGHYVLVTGKLGTTDTHAPGQSQYQIEDPGRSCPSPPCTLDGHGYLNPQTNQTDFITRGFIKDPSGDMSELNLSIGDNADILIVDPAGRRTGFDPGTGQTLREIP